MKLADLNILYINLKRRNDRKKFIEEQLNNMKLTYTRIDAIDALQFTDEQKKFYESRSNFNVLDKNKSQIYGKAACYLSHMKALKYAIDNKLDNVLIIEDDCVFLSDKSLEYNFDIPNYTYIYYLGGLFWPKEKPFNPDKQIAKKNNIYIDTNVFKLACAVAYIIPSHNIMCEIYNIMTTKMKKAVDMMYVTHIQKKFPCYIHNPPLCLQSDFISDVTNVNKTTPKKPFNNEYFYVKDIDNQINARKFWKKYN